MRLPHALTALYLQAQAQGKRDPLPYLHRPPHLLTSRCAGFFVCAFSAFIAPAYLPSKYPATRSLERRHPTSNLTAPNALPSLTTIPPLPACVPTPASIMSTNSLKRKYSSDDVDVDMDSLPQANGTTNGVGDDLDLDAPQLRPQTPSFLHTDPRPDDFAHAGMRRSIALALDHVGFDSADTVAVESFALATEECMASRDGVMLAAES